MIYQKEIERLEYEWSPETGFFWRVRQGRFEVDGFERALKTLAAFSPTEETEIPRRLVSLLWYIPLLMRWQIERVQENGGDATAYLKAITVMTNEVERLLGVP